MSLLDDVSIVVTPNGYKAGELYAVIPVPTEGAEEVSDGNFLLTGTQAQNTTGTYWTTGTGITISGGSANFTGNSNANISQANGVVVGTRYRLTFTISNYVSGDIDINVGGNTRQGSYFGDNDYTIDVICNGGNSLYFQENSAAGGFVGSISNISVKEYTSADMDVTRATAATRVDENGLVNYAEVIGGDLITDGEFPSNTNWNENNAACEIIGGKAVWTSAPNSTGFVGINLNDNICEIGKTYKVTYTIDSVTEGKIRIRYPDFGTQYNSSGTYPLTVTNTLTATSTDIYFQCLQTTTASISNISVKEVTRDNVPRIDYTGGGCPHILAEPQRTNLVTYSEVYGAGTFFSGTSGSTIDNTTNTSPSGDDNATQVTSTGAGKIQSGGLGLTQNTDYVLSFYAKNVDATEVKSRVLATGGSGGSNLTSVSYISELSTTEWTRITHSFNTGTNTTIYVYISNVLNSGGTIQLWGAQLEEGSYATSYIPTSGSTVTRNQDIFTRDGIGSLINSTEGVLFVEMAALADDETNREITLSDGSTVNYVLIRFNNGGSNRIYTRVDVGGGNEYYDLDTSHTITNTNKIAIRWGASNFATFINGVKVGSQLSGSSFSADTLNELNFDNGVGVHNFFGKVKQLQVYDTALTDDTIALLTS
jgi:hypothetical protein